MIRIYSSILLFFIFISGCSFNPFSEEDKQPESAFSFNYYSDKSVSSLEVPPDLTKPDIQNSFRIQKIAKNVQLNEVNLSNKENNKEIDTILKIPTDIKLMKSGSSRWLSVEKDSETLWELSRDFFKSQGFTLEKENKKTGIFQTNYLENRPRPRLPSSNLNIIKQMLQDVGSVYSLATLDSYRIRIEPQKEGRTEIYLTLSQLKEVISQETTDVQHTVFQQTEKDSSIEIEMLLDLMAYLGGDTAGAREKILEASEKKSSKVIFKIEDSINGYAKLTSSLNVNDTWDNISWALDQMRIDIDDKDMMENTFYINSARTSDLGVMSMIFGDDAIKKSYQIIVKQKSANQTEVYFNDVSELNEKETKDFSYDFFRKVVEQFK